MDRETLLKEHAQCKKRLTTFAILEGVCIGIITLLSLIYVIVVAALAISFEDMTMIEQEFGIGMIVATYIYIILLVNVAIAADVFVPFIIINAIKMGKRNKLLRELDKQNG